MKTLLFKEILISSNLERKARRIMFDPRLTIIRGENETGKSSLIKSIFRTFGAEPAKVHEKWIATGATSVLKFEVGGVAYGILRHGETRAIFDANGNLLKRFRSITNDLAPYFAKLMDFGLRLPDRDGSLKALPPAYYFLPYYMDQDSSWSSQWSGFAKLMQFKNWKKSLIQYHAGIRGNTYYESQALILDAKSEKSKVSRKREGLQEIYSDLNEKYSATDFNVDFSAYKKEIDELLAKCDVLRKSEEDYKNRVSDLYNQRQSLKTQLDITLHARNESKKDFDHANAIGHDELACPTCGANYDNSFAERFSIAADEDHCASLALTLAEELADVDAKISRELATSNKIGLELANIERLLAKREGQVALADLIEQEGRKELRNIMSADIESYKKSEADFQARIEEVEERVKRLRGKDKKKEVNDYYENKMRSFLHQLDVNHVSESSIRNVDAAMRDTGSELPRALLAHQMAFYHVMNEFGSSAIAPLVIDSPNQQDQDLVHLERILNFIKESQPKNSQLILGMVNDADVEFEGRTVVLNRKYSLLLEEEYDDVGAEVRAYVDAAISG